MDLIDRVKEIVFGKEINIIEGSPDAYDQVKAMTNKGLKKYIGVAPIDVPKEIQEELFQRFAHPCALQTCPQCYGRGHTGWNLAIHQLAPCLCLQRVIRDEQTKENQKIILMN